MTRRVCPIRHGLSRFRNFLIGLLVLVGIAVYFYPTLFQTVNSRLAKHVEKELNVHLNRIGICSRVKHARFIDGQGIEISGIHLQCSEGHTLAGIENAFIHAPVQLPELLSSKLTPTAIELTGATLIITRDREGQWDIQETIRQLSGMTPAGQKPVPLIIRESTIQIVDHFQVPARTIELSNLDFQLNPLPDDPTQFAAAGAITGFRTGRFTFRCTPDECGYGIEFRLSNLPINQTTIGFLPKGARPKEIRAVVGSISGIGSARLNHGKQKFENLTARGKIKRTSLDHAQIPYLIADCNGDFELANNQIRASLNGKLGTSGQYGQFQTDVSHRLNANVQNWTATGTLNHLLIDSHLARYFGPAIQKFFGEFRPKGTVNIDFQLTQNEDGFSRVLDSQLLDMSFNYEKFPYPVHNATGTAKVINDEVRFVVSATEQGQPLGLQGVVKGNGPKALLEVDFWSDGKIAINKKLANAISASPKIAQSLFDFRPAGFLKVYGQLRKSPEQSRAVLNYDVELFDCSAQHVHFEYPIQQIYGNVYVRDGHITVEDVHGSHKDARVNCNGTWDLQTGLDLKFDAYQVPMDSTLANALKPDLRSVWDSIRPSGNAHYVHVDLVSSPGKGTNIEVESTLADPNNPLQATAAINPVSFPYPVGKLDGKVYIGNGKVNLELARGRHGETWISCLGDGSYSESGWALTLSDMRVGSLVTDEDLLDAVPASLREALEELNYEGSLSGTGTVAMRGRCDEGHKKRIVGQIAQASFETPVETTPGGFEMDWNVRLDMDRGRFNVGIIAENVFGSVSLNGRYANESVRCAGSIALDSLHWNETQFTNIRGPLWIEDQRVGVGSMARPDNEATTPNSLTGNLFGGTLRLDGQCWQEREKRFYVQASVSNLDIKKAGQQKAPSLNEVGGSANIAFRVGGGETTESMRGEGIFQLRNANIYELPVVLSMLKMMKTRRRDRTAFDASNADFTIQGNSINISKIELLGDAISLVGKGTMTMDHEVDLDFYTVAGRNRFHIPLISDLAKAGSQQILWLRVDGSLENPQVYSELLPGLNESVRQLFQTAEPPPPRLQRAQNSDTRWR